MISQNLLRGEKKAQMDSGHDAARLIRRSIEIQYSTTLDDYLEEEEETQEACSRFQCTMWNREQ